MKMKLLLTVAFLLAAVPGAFAQAAPDGAAKPKVAIIDSAIWRTEVLELKAKYDKLEAEFAPKYRDLESMGSSIATKQKVAQENKSLTPQQAQKLGDEIEQLKKEYNRAVQDSQDLAAKREKDETGATYEKIFKFLEQYCAKHGIVHAFDARRLQDTGVVVFVAQGANITRDFISEYNKANPVQASANPAK
ncbi:MAG TPA: OmpH family outer membrane protein [Blastocatellia bacterium]|jgi:Skp family chaperone for outer membrane proteins|nr:OmpH family outer membrane protein [Blastocatellia bacterium]